jgi:hypothetical protein
MSGGTTSKVMPPRYFKERQRIFRSKDRWMHRQTDRERGDRKTKTDTHTKQKTMLITSLESRSFSRVNVPAGKHHLVIYILER